MTRHDNNESRLIAAARERVGKRYPNVQVRNPAAPWHMMPGTRVDAPAMTRHAGALGWGD